MDFGSVFSGLGTGIVSGLFGRKSQKRGFNQERALTEQAQAFQKSEREAMQDMARHEAWVARQFSSDEALKSRTFSAKQAQKQMDFQERMSSTQNQRAAADLEKAGLNRILALGRPAVAPSGAMAQSQAASAQAARPSTGGAPKGSQGPNPSGTVAAGVQAGVAMATAKERIETEKATQKLLRAQAYKAGQEGRSSKAWADKMESLGIPASMLLDNLGRGGAASKEVQKWLEKLQSSTGGSIIDLLKNAVDMGSSAKENAQTYIKIKRANHPKDRKKNWEDKK